MNLETSDRTAAAAAVPAPQKINPLAYFIAVMSVMPLLGVILGPIALIWGLSARNRGGKPVAAIGAVGFASQSLFFIFLFHKMFG